MTTMLNPIIPELSVTDVTKSLSFYVNVLGFSVAYQRKEEGFALITLGDIQIMLDEINKGRTWTTGELNYPLGRGINLQLRVNCIDPFLAQLKQHDIQLFQDVEEKWYRQNTCEVGNKQFLVMDPDGYLLRLTESLGSRSIQGSDLI